MKLLLVILAIVFTSASVRAEEYCGKNKIFVIPEMTFQLKAGGQNLLAQSIAKLNIITAYKWIWDIEGSGWVPDTYRYETVKLEFDTENEVIKIPRQEFKLNKLPAFKSPSLNCLELPEVFMFVVNYKPHYKDEIPQGENFGKNKKYAYNYNYIYLPEDGIAKKFKTNQVNFLELPPNMRLAGRISYPNNTFYLQVPGVKEPYYLVSWLTNAEHKCLKKLVSEHPDVEIWGSLRNPDYYLFDVYDLGFATEAYCDPDSAAIQ